MMASPDQRDFKSLDLKAWLENFRVLEYGRKIGEVTFEVLRVLVV